MKKANRWSPASRQPDRHADDELEVLVGVVAAEGEDGDAAGGCIAHAGGEPAAGVGFRPLMFGSRRVGNDRQACGIDLVLLTNASGGHCGLRCDQFAAAGCEREQSTLQQ